MYNAFLSLLLITLLALAFFLASNYSSWEESSKSSFECGFNSYFMSRSSFSVHYFLIALTFLFLDLELCFLFPFFLEDSMSLKTSLFFFKFVFILTAFLIVEWKSGMMDWKN